MSRDLSDRASQDYVIWVDALFQKIHVMTYGDFTPSARVKLTKLGPGGWETPPSNPEMCRFVDQVHIIGPSKSL